jgi:hypothetical protein
MKPGNTEEESNKIHGDKLEHTEGESANIATPPRPSALDQLEIPPHEAPRTDGGTKVHGDKLDPHSGKETP